MKKKVIAGFMIVLLAACACTVSPAEEDSDATVFSLVQYAIEHFYIQPESVRDVAELMDLSAIDASVTEVSFFAEQNMLLLGGTDKEGKAVCLLYSYGDKDGQYAFPLLPMLLSSYRFMIESSCVPDEKLTIILTVNDQQFIADTPEKADGMLEAFKDMAGDQAEEP